MTDKPRRSTRQPVRIPVVQTSKSVAAYDPAAEPPRGTKRKAPKEPVDPQAQLLKLLENPKSILTTIDASEVLNANAWNMLSNESREALEALLPPTAFIGYTPGADNSSQYPQENSEPVFSERALNLSIFNDSYFLDAMHTFQDHLFSGWHTASHADKVKKYLDGIQDGSLAAPWKDDVWERENPRPPTPPPTDSESTGAVPNFYTKGKAGASADLKLSDLVKDGVLRIGDLIAYRRNFSILGIVVEKDAIIQSIDPLTLTLTVLIPRSSVKSLPSTLTCQKPGSPGSDVLSATTSTPQMLETFILDTDGQVKRSQRPNGNAWKCFTVWRWREGNVISDTTGDRGGREVHGTLFYLRGSHYYER